MIKRALYVISIFLIFSCTKDNEEIIKPDPQLEIKILGEKEFLLESEDLDPAREKSLLYLNLHVNSLNEYIITGITTIDRNETWGEFILKTNDTLSKLYLKVPTELNFDGNTYGGELNSQIVENNNILIFGPLNNSKCIIAKYTSKGELLWFKLLEGEYSDLQIVNIILLQNDYYYIGRRYKTWSDGAASLITNVGKMSMDGNIIFNKTLENFSLGFTIEKYSNNSFIITAAKFFTDNQQSFDMRYNKVHPFIIHVDTSGNILWESSVDELETDLFHPIVFYARKGTDGIYCVYNKRSVSDEALLTKLDLNGNVLWTKSITGIENFGPSKTFRLIYDITLDWDNNVYLVGYATTDRVWGIPFIGVAKFGSNGAYLDSYTNSHSDKSLIGYSIEIDRDGHIVVVSTDENDDIIVFKLNQDLDLL